MGKGKIPTAEKPQFYTSDVTAGYIKTHRDAELKWLRLPAYRYTSAEIGRKKNDDI